MPHYSLESLEAFVQAVESGSFSAAARVLHKSQSTVSTAIANLEADLGFALFERKGRSPVLTEAGRRMLVTAQAVLDAGRCFSQLARRLAGDVEPHLSLAITDFWQASHHEHLLRQLEARYPDMELECMIAEDADVLELLQTGRIHVGVIRTQPTLPANIRASRLQIQAEMAIYLHQRYPLAHKPGVSLTDLHDLRQLCLNTTLTPRPLRQPERRVWFAPSYLLLLEMAEQGFGWSILPRWLVRQFGHHVLRELPVPGFPQHIAMDAVWSKRTPPGPAGQWMIGQLCAQR